MGISISCPPPSKARQVNTGLMNERPFKPPTLTVFTGHTASHEVYCMSRGTGIWSKLIQNLGDITGYWLVEGAGGGTSEDGRRLEFRFP